MRDGRLWIAAAGLLALLTPAPTRAQGVGFQPIVAPLPDGVMMNTTPVVSADRRYVRLTMNLGFQSITGFQTYSVPAAVSGGLGGGFGGVGGGLGGFGGAVGMNGPVADGGPSYAGVAANPGRSRRTAPAVPIDPGAGPTDFASSLAQFVDPAEQAAPAARPKAPKRRPTRAASARPARVGPG